MNTKIKICGLTFPENIEEIAALRPDYMGFIFYPQSPRNLKHEIPPITKSTQKVGVFVNATLEEIHTNVIKHRLDLVQLHGEESPEFCSEIERKSIKVIKSFAIDNSFNFKMLEEYKKSCTYFLFDTKGPQYGGNGISFDWSVLAKYNLNKPYFLSGGIGIESANELKAFFQKDYAKSCLAIDLNSQFENTPGHKNPERLKSFMQNIKQTL
jgi:phosphoribosylanthranilate isomerase